MKNTRYSLRALARLLSYPDAQLRSELAPLIAAIDEEASVPAPRRAELRSLAADYAGRGLRLQWSGGMVQLTTAAEAASAGF